MVHVSAPRARLLGGGIGRARARAPCHRCQAQELLRRRLLVMTRNRRMLRRAPPPLAFRRRGCQNVYDIVLFYTSCRIIRFRILLACTKAKCCFNDWESELPHRPGLAEFFFKHLFQQLFLIVSWSPSSSTCRRCIPPARDDSDRVSCVVGTLPYRASLHTTMSLRALPPPL